MSLDYSLRANYPATFRWQGHTSLYPSSACITTTYACYSQRALLPPPLCFGDSSIYASDFSITTTYACYSQRALLPPPLCFGDSSIYASDFIPFVFSLSHYSTGFSMVTKSFPFLKIVTFPEDSEMTMATALVKLVIPAAAM